MQQCISYVQESASATAPLDSLVGRYQFANLPDLTDWSALIGSAPLSDDGRPSPGT
jgi:hypothetical protein